MHCHHKKSHDMTFLIYLSVSHYLIALMDWGFIDFLISSYGMMFDVAWHKYIMTSWHRHHKKSHAMTGLPGMSDVWMPRWNACLECLVSVMLPFIIISHRLQSNIHSFYFYNSGLLKPPPSSVEREWIRFILAFDVWIVTGLRIKVAWVVLIAKCRGTIFGAICCNIPVPQMSAWHGLKSDKTSQPPNCRLSLWRRIYS